MVYRKNRAKARNENEGLMLKALSQTFIKCLIKAFVPQIVARRGARPSYA